MLLAIDRVIPEYRLDVDAPFDTSGQATIEAAFVIPIVMILILLLLQPGIILYDRIVMKGAALEGCRLLATTHDPSTNEDYMRRRLSAIPEVDIFHVHTSGCSYEIELLGDEVSDEVKVRIATEIKPLPLLDIAMGVGGLLNASGNMHIEVEASMPTQPEWVSTSSNGSSPSEWSL